MIYIGIPVYDERHTIGPLLWRIRELFTELGREYRLLVVDDASEDGTAEALEPYRQYLPLTVLRHPERRGYAASVERLLRETVARSAYLKRDGLITLQADFTDPPEALPELVRRFEGGADLVLGVPPSDGKGGEEPEEAPKEEERREAAEAEGKARRTPAAVPRSVRIARFGARLVARGLPRPPGVAEPYGSLRLYRLFLVDRAIRDLESRDERLLTQEGWAANAELLLTVWPHARRVAEVEAGPDYGRRYRSTRLRTLAELRSLRRAAREARLRELAARLEVA
ncbi:MAG: glycosyltransferase family 2 protein [Gemmatimonadota bacterium]